jgi:hypothetical protein
VDTPANKRHCHNKRHEEEEEVADAMAMAEEDAAGVGAVARGWEDEDDGTGWKTTWDTKKWWQQLTMGGCQQEAEADGK